MAKPAGTAKRSKAPAKATPAPTTSPAPPPAWWLPLVVALYALVSLLYLTATPLQEITLPDNVPAAQAQTPLLVGIGPDEKEHFLYIASLANRGKLPAQAPAFRRSPDDYVSYEVQHPPVFFAVCAVLYKLFSPLGLPALWMILRGFCALCGAGAIILTDRAAKIAFPDRPFVVWGTAPLMAFLPTFGHTMGNLSNEPLALLIGAFLWLQVVRIVRQADISPSPPWRDAGLLGLTFGLGVVTKLTVIVWLPALGVALFWLLFRRKAAFVPTLAAFVLPVLVCALPWFGYLQNTFGTLTFRSHMRPLLQNVSLADYLQNPTQKLFPKNVPRGVVMPPAYLLLWGVSTAWVPFWLILFYLPGGPQMSLVWQTLLLVGLLVPLLALFTHFSRTNTHHLSREPSARAILWAGGGAMLMATLTLLTQIFYVDWSMTNYGGRYMVAAWPAGATVIAFALSTLGEMRPDAAQRQKMGAIAVAALLFLDVYAALLVRQFYAEHPTQPALQRSEEVAQSISTKGTTWHSVI